MNVKAIMCDIDGTLLSSEGVVTKKTVEMIKKAREKGTLFGLSTGRDVNRIQTLLGTWGVEGLVDMDCNFAIPEDGIFYSPKDDEYIQDLSKGDRVPYKVVDYNEYLTSPKAKLIIICKPEYMDQIIERSKTFHSDDYKSSSLKTASVFYEYMDPRISKTAGLKEILKLHHIDIKDIVTFGDADNDYDMTLNAGIGVVMANGSEKTKSVADYITDDNDHDGIGNYIEKYIL